MIRIGLLVYFIFNLFTAGNPQTHARNYSVLLTVSRLTEFGDSMPTHGFQERCAVQLWLLLVAAALSPHGWIWWPSSRLCKICLFLLLLMRIMPPCGMGFLTRPPLQPAGMILPLVLTGRFTHELCIETRASRVQDGASLLVVRVSSGLLVCSGFRAHIWLGM